MHVYYQRQKFSFQSNMVRKTGAENQRQKMESIYGGASFWSVCHVYEIFEERHPPPSKNNNKMSSDMGLIKSYKKLQRVILYMFTAGRRLKAEACL